VAKSSLRTDQLPRPPCPGDRNTNRRVAVDELVTTVNIALGTAAIDTCRACDPDLSGTVTADELVKAVNSALNGCVQG